MTSRPTPDILAELRHAIRDEIAVERPTYETVDRILVLLTPLLDATHEAACRAMREEAAKYHDEEADTFHHFMLGHIQARNHKMEAKCDQRVQEHRQDAAMIRGLPLPKREG